LEFFSGASLVLNDHPCSHHFGAGVVRKRSSGADQFYFELCDFFFTRQPHGDCRWGQHKQHSECISIE
jgi:hypothetical protein